MRNNCTTIRHRHRDTRRPEGVWLAGWLATVLMAGTVLAMAATALSPG